MRTSEMFCSESHGDVKGERAAAIDDNDLGRQYPVALKEAILFDAMRIVGRSVSDDFPSAVIDTKAHAMAGQD